MRNTHDVGGQLGHGPVDRHTDDGHVFHHPYEELAFGLTLASIANGFLHNVDENRFAKERMAPLALSSSTYYELWLASLEMNLVENGVLDLETIQAREDAIMAGAPRPSAPEPDGLGDVLAGMIAMGGSMAGDAPEARRFAVGDRVVARISNNRRHTRLPGYLMGRTGTVVRTFPAFPLPEVVAHERRDVREWTYQVHFDAPTLWGAEGTTGDSVLVDVWESYISAAPRGTAPTEETP